MVGGGVGVGVDRMEVWFESLELSNFFGLCMYLAGRRRGGRGEKEGKGVFHVNICDLKKVKPTTSSVGLFVWYDTSSRKSKTPNNPTTCSNTSLITTE